jgi:transcriptional regulator with XRE-family HTH domain
MDNSSEVRDFLTTRRARITPQDANLPTYGDKRRVPGLRREEVALLSGVSADYYTRLERGNLSGVSESVLDAVCRALQLDEAERAHMFDLARAASPSTRPRTTRLKRGLRPGVQRILDSISTTPAYVRNGRFDILGANQLGRALFAEMYDGDRATFNLARYLFLDSRSQDFYVEWERVARDCAQSSHRSRPQPLRQSTHRSRRRALHPQ